MATFANYWERLRNKNSGLQDDDGKLTISVSSFKRQLERAYSQGGADREKAMRLVQRAAATGDPSDFLRSIFGS